MNDLEQDLDQLRRQGLYRTRRTLDSPQSVRVRVDGQEWLSFCSNDYLGLANHPEVVAALSEGVQRHGVGSGASHLVSGHHRAHHALEEELAEFVGAERALLFSAGYMANLGAVAALVPPEGVVYSDRLNHASLIDAARLARAEVVVYPHRDVAALKELRARQAGQPGIIITDAVFSMDGDLAPLPELIDLARAENLRVYADDAHGLGVLGAAGRGSFEHWGLTLRPPAIVMGTLGKAFGVFGAFVAGEAALIETLIQHARTYIYTTALPPAVAEAVRASLKLMHTEGWRREHLRALIARFRAGIERLGFNAPASLTPIQPLILGTAEHALAASEQLRAAGILIPAIRPPTVPVGTARLRITLSAAHSFDDVDRLLAALAQSNEVRAQRPIIQNRAQRARLASLSRLRERE